ncbi:hypothetical protein BGZ57DRAFT_1020191 [Hyaloscypha finlandica]|nr:hypothetical protein BGZ57DRAFT_1020191 [Hyaloscypha finlandica]
MATYYMYFPFLTYENAHSMTMAVRGIVELFRLIKREKELHREILAFLISHDHSSMAYQMTTNVYDIWMPDHLKRICSVIDELPPDVDFEVSQESELGESGLSQGLESRHLSDQSSTGRPSTGRAETV